MVRWITCAALACCAMGCVRESDQSAITAEVSGANHIIVRAEYGRVWWSRTAWSEPHELWALPSTGTIEELHVAKSDAGFVVTFQQNGKPWSGTFNPDPKRYSASGSLAQREGTP